MQFDTIDKEQEELKNPKDQTVLEKLQTIYEKYPSLLDYEFFKRDKEIEDLKPYNIDFNLKLLISKKAHIILPTHTRRKKFWANTSPQKSRKKGAQTGTFPSNRFIVHIMENASRSTDKVRALRCRLQIRNNATFRR